MKKVGIEDYSYYVVVWKEKAETGYVVFVQYNTVICSCNVAIYIRGCMTGQIAEFK